MEVDEVMIRNYLDKMTFEDKSVGRSYQRIIGKHRDMPEITAKISLLHSSTESFRYHVGINYGDSQIMLVKFYENLKDPEIAEDLEYLSSLDKSEEHSHILFNKLAKGIFFDYAIPELERGAKNEMDFTIDISRKLSRISGKHVSASFTPIDLVNMFPHMRHIPLSIDNQACVSKFEDLKLYCYFRNGGLKTFKGEDWMGMHEESYLASFEHFDKPLRILNYSIITKDGEANVSGDPIMKDIFNLLVIPKVSELQNELVKFKTQKNSCLQNKRFL